MNNEKRGLSIIKKLLIILTVLFLGAVAFFLALFPRESRLAKQLPLAISSLNQKDNVQSVKLNNINPFIQEAAIASQDEHFYNNWGVDFAGTIRAIAMTISTGQRQGASTITEQLGKNAYFKDRDNLVTDIDTKLLAPFITLNFPKETILEMYLNSIYFGKNAYGIYNASKTYFNTTPDKVTLAQAAFMIGLIDAPSYFAADKKAAIVQAQIVLGEMARDKFISVSQEDEAEKMLQKF